MFFRPLPKSREMLEDEVLEVDLDQSLECGNVSLGRVAIYISGKGKKNKFYIPYSAISKAFKKEDRKAKGDKFYLEITYDGSTPLVVDMNYEEDIDIVIAYLAYNFPEIKTVTEKDEKLALKARHEVDRKALKKLSDTALDGVNELRKEKNFMEENGFLFSYRLSLRSLAIRKSKNRIAFFFLFILGLLMSLFSLYFLTISYSGNMFFSMLIGILLIYIVFAYEILPTKRNRRKFAKKEEEKVNSEIKALLDSYDGTFQLPPDKAHPLVADMMISILRLGKAESIHEALEILSFSLDSDTANEYADKIKKYVSPLFSEGKR